MRAPCAHRASFRVLFVPQVHNAGITVALACLWAACVLPPFHWREGASKSYKVQKFGPWNL